MAERSADKQYQRNDSKYDYRQPHIHTAQDHKRSDDLDSRNKEFLGAVMRKLRHFKQVIGDTRHQRADLCFVVIRKL